MTEKQLAEAMGFQRNAWGMRHPAGIELVGDLPSCSVRVLDSEGFGSYVLVGREELPLATKIAFAFSYLGSLEHDSRKFV